MTGEKCEGYKKNIGDVVLPELATVACGVIAEVITTVDQ